MTFHLQNTLYVQTPDALVKLDHDALAIHVDGRPPVRVPLLHLHGVVLLTAHESPARR